MWSNQNNSGFGGSGFGRNSKFGGGFSGGDQGFGGGGFSPAGGGFASPSQAQPSKSRFKQQTLIPCTVQHILTSEQDDDTFKVGDVNIHQVTVVGVIRSVREQATNITYEIDDMSGPPIEVKLWVENTEDTPEVERVKPLMENTYARVCGNVRSFQERKNIVAFKVMPVTDPDEITSHMLEVMYAHMYLSKHKAKVAEPSFLATGDQFGNFGANSFSAASNQPPQQQQQQQQMNGLTNMQNQILKLICSATEPEGISIQTIQQQIRNPNQSAVRDAIEFLFSEGHVYSTIDDDHFKSIE